LTTSSALAATDLSGMWWIKDRTELAAIDHKTLPLTPAAAAQYAKNQANVAAGHPLPIGNLPCLLEGMPRLMLARYPFQILQRPSQITFIHERLHQARLIYMNEDLPADIDELDPYYNGHSVGHWDGDSLVVNTAGIKPNSYIDRTGIPHTDRMQLTERFTLRDKGQTLRDVITVNDPQTFTKAWSFTIDYAKRPDVELMDDVCPYGPPQRDVLGKNQ
jgi:hypothetical protein